MAAFFLFTLPAVWAAAAPLRPQIVCDAPVFDFGEASNFEVVEHDFIIRNDGKLSLEIRNIRVSCGCTAAKSSEDVIPPGGTATIHVAFNLRNRNGHQNKTITLETNDPETPRFVLQMTGTALQIFRAMPQALVYGALTAPEPRTVTISSESRSFIITKLTTSAPALTVTGEGLDQPAKSHQIRVEVDPSGLSGRFDLEVLVQTDMPGVAPLKIPVVGYTRELEP